METSKIVCYNHSYKFTASCSPNDLCIHAYSEAHQKMFERTMGYMDLTPEMRAAFDNHRIVFGVLEEAFSSGSIDLNEPACRLTVGYSARYAKAEVQRSFTIDLHRVEIDELMKLKLQLGRYT
jgi:hypothetical protein